MSFKEPIVRNIIAVAITISAALSGYFAAYTGLRVELAGKAEERYVAEMDIRLSRLEAVINERFATKDDLVNLKKEMLDKLTAIQTVLSDME
ncbi:MAG: hypothetical protein JSU85_10570 [Candidatus Zixiibacteriota bacterium]|nr:MAG: hypothetical protein JSU85_10570 [candidate division Zixibacteria bacterium]